jgi:hypothetical protein
MDALGAFSQAVVGFTGGMMAQQEKSKAEDIAMEDRAQKRKALDLTMDMEQRRLGFEERRLDSGERAQLVELSMRAKELGMRGRELALRETESGIRTEAERIALDEKKDPALVYMRVYGLPRSGAVKLQKLELLGVNAKTMAELGAASVRTHRAGGSKLSEGSAAGSGGGSQARDIDYLTQGLDRLATAMTRTDITPEGRLQLTESFARVKGLLDNYATAATPSDKAQMEGETLSALDKAIALTDAMYGTDDLTKGVAGDKKRDAVTKGAEARPILDLSHQFSDAEVAEIQRELTPSDKAQIDRDMAEAELEVRRTFGAVETDEDRQALRLAIQSRREHVYASSLSMALAEKEKADAEEEKRRIASAERVASKTKSVLKRSGIGLTKAAEESSKFFPRGAERPARSLGLEILGE